MIEPRDVDHRPETEKADGSCSCPCGGACGCESGSQLSEQKAKDTRRLTDAIHNETQIGG